jgi:hypothetical protein
MTTIAPPPRKTLLEWITDDDGDQPDHAQLVSSPAIAALHVRIVRGQPGAGDNDGPREPLPPPPGFGLAPLG